MSWLMNMLAEGAATGSGSGQPPGLLQGPFIPMVLILGVLMLFTFRSKRRQDRERVELLSKIKAGDRVLTTGGIVGTVTQASDTFVVVKVDETSNVKMKFVRSAILRLFDEDKAETK